jgi:hypothetical protein
MAVYLRGEEGSVIWGFLSSGWLITRTLKSSERDYWPAQVIQNKVTRNFLINTGGKATGARS